MGFIPSSTCREIFSSTTTAKPPMPRHIGAADVIHSRRRYSILYFMWTTAGMI
jgi:hypothetical protein